MDTQVDPPASSAGLEEVSEHYSRREALFENLLYFQLEGFSQKTEIIDPTEVDNYTSSPVR